MFYIIYFREVTLRNLVYIILIKDISIGPKISTKIDIILSF